MTHRVGTSGPRRGRAPWLVIALTPALLATSCPVLVRVGVEPGPTAAEPPRFAFSIDREQLRAIDSLTVFECAERMPHGVEHDSARQRLPVAWSIFREPGAAPGPEPVRITYGRVPAGYREQKAAVPVEPGGCYHARAVSLPDRGVRSRTYGFPVEGGQTFRLLPDGRLVTGDLNLPLFDSRPLRELNRAAVGCRRGYGRARTAADTAAVNARGYTIQGTDVSCGWLRAHWPDAMHGAMTSERMVFGALGLAAALAAILAAGAAEEDR